ncbi:MAG: hypothetical protein HFI87_07850 [Bacilli bacterium]|nr:hypothetical protein [Bacilli bacterium]
MSDEFKIAVAEECFLHIAKCESSIEVFKKSMSDCTDEFIVETYLSCIEARQKEIQSWKNILQSINF